MRRILIVVNDSAFFLSHRLPIAVAAKSAGYDVHVATIKSDASKKIQALGFSFHSLKISRTSTNIFSEFWSILSLVKLFMQVKPDIVHLVTIKPVLYGAIAARFARVPAVLAAVSGLGPAFEEKKGFLKTCARSLVILLYKVAFSHKRIRVVFQNHYDLELLTRVTKIPNENVLIIPGSGVDLEQYEHNTKKSDVPIAIMGCRFVEGKGVNIFVEAATILLKRGVEMRFWLAGSLDPNNPGALDWDEVEKWKVESPVEFLGHRKDMPYLIKQAHIAVLPSEYGEGLPKFLIEAAACGVAVITTDHPGCRDSIIQNVSGLLIPKRDPVALADSLQWLVEHPVQRENMGAAARRLAEKRFSIDDVVDRHLEIYWELTRDVNTP